MKGPGSQTPGHQQERERLEVAWRGFSERAQAKLDRGQALTGREKSELSRLLELWSGAGIVKAEQWGQREVARFKREFARQLKASKLKEARGQLYTLEDFKEHEEALGAWIVLGELETEAMTDEEIAAYKQEHKERVSNRPPADRTRPAFVHASTRLGMEYLAMPLSERQQEAWGQGFWNACAKRENALLARQRKELELAAAKAVVPWSGLASTDYEFHKWAKDKDDRELQLAAYYEYARESRQLRGLLASGIRCARCDRKSVAVPSFEGLTEEDAQKGPLGRWFLVLQVLADDLVQNTPFASLSPSSIERALYHTCPGDGPAERLWCRLDDTIAGFCWYKKPISLAVGVDKRDATDFETYLDWLEVEGRVKPSKYKRPLRQRVWRQHKEVDFGEVLALEVHWKEYSNAELAESFAEFLAQHRPEKKFPEPPSRRRKGKSSVNRRSFYAALDNLAALRLLSHSAKEDSAHQAYKGIVANPIRRDHFKSLGRAARKIFKELFPSDQQAANHGRWS